MQQPAARISYLTVSLVTVMLALIGMETIMYEFFSDSSITFHVIIMVWMADQFDSLVIQSRIGRRHFFRFFFLYQFIFYAYHYRFNGQYSGLALLTTMLLTYHSMLYFFHHHELPLLRYAYIQRQQQFQQQQHQQQHHHPHQHQQQHQPPTNQSDANQQIDSLINTTTLEELNNPILSDSSSLANEMNELDTLIANNRAE